MDTPLYQNLQNTEHCCTATRNWRSGIFCYPNSIIEHPMIGFSQTNSFCLFNLRQNTTCLKSSILNSIIWNLGGLTINIECSNPHIRMRCTYVRMSFHFVIIHSMNTPECTLCALIRDKIRDLHHNTILQLNKRLYCLQ